MSDGMSAARKAAREAEEYLLKKGWYKAEGLYLSPWSHPDRKGNLSCELHEAMGIQYEWDEKEHKKVGDNNSGSSTTPVEDKMSGSMAAKDYDLVGQVNMVAAYFDSLGSKGEALQRYQRYALEAATELKRLQDVEQKYIDLCEMFEQMRKQYLEWYTGPMPDKEILLKLEAILCPQLNRARLAKQKVYEWLSSGTNIKLHPHTAAVQKLIELAAELPKAQ